MAMLMAIVFMALLIGAIAFVSEMLVANFDRIVAALAGKSLSSSTAGTFELGQIITMSRKHPAVAQPPVTRRQEDWLLAA